MQDGLLCSLCKAGKGILGARELRVLGLLCCTMQDTARLGGEVRNLQLHRHLNPSQGTATPCMDRSEILKKK